MGKTKKHEIDPGDCLIVWIARLEDAVRDGDRAAEREARDRLTALGIRRIEFDSRLRVVARRAHEGEGAP